MPQRSTRRTARTLLAAAVGAVVLGTAVPAAAAVPAPTITAPASRTGFGPVTLTGTAQPGALVRLYESALNWNDLQPAVNFDTGRVIETKADSAGRYTFVRNVDTGFLFAARSGGVTSAPAKVLVRVVGVLHVSSPRARTVSVTLQADPAQPELPLKILRQEANGTWTILSRRITDAKGGLTLTLTGQPAGARSYRAWIGGDAETGITSNYSAAVRITVR
jgi:hypothetical protein